MKIGDIVKGEAARINGGPVIGPVIAVRDNTLIISSSTGGTETIRKKGAEFVSEAKVLAKKCYQCEKMLELAEYRTLRNGQKDKVCKECRADKVREGMKNKNEKSEKVEQINNKEAYLKAVDAKGKTAEPLPDETIAKQIAKDYGGSLVQIETQVILKVLD